MKTDETSKEDKKTIQSDMVEDSNIDDDKQDIRIISEKRKGFLESLANKADEIKRQSIDFGRMAAREAEEIGEKIEDTVENKIDATKKLKSSNTSKNEILDLLERLAELKKHEVITEGEFNAKKKDLLDKI